MSNTQKRALVDASHEGVTLSRQCELLGLPRSTYYYAPHGESEENLKLMRRIDELHLQRPYYGSRRMVEALCREGYYVNRKRIVRLMQLMGLVAIYPGPKTTTQHPAHKKYPYLLRNLTVKRPDHVWCADITYIPMRYGFLYLVAVMDWLSRYVLAWELSNSLTSDFCVEALSQALQGGCPEIFNTDQGVQFTSLEFVSELEARAIAVSMDGKGRALDNVFIERVWRSLKYEEVYLKAYNDGFSAAQSIGEYFKFYNCERPHQGLDYCTPQEIYYGALQ